MADFNIRVKVDPSGAKTGSKEVEGALGRVETRANRLRQTLLRTFAAVGITASLAGGVKTLADFGQQMSTVRAITGATDSEFARLSDTAKDLGATTRYSATQAGEGLLFLARAGFDVNESIETVDDTLRLAQAGALDLGSAADIATNVLTGFRLKTDQAGRVVDVLALAANSANTDVRQLGDAMKFVAPVAAGVGVELETAAAAVGALSDAGLQAGLAGTGLRKVLGTLEAPTKAEADILKELGVRADEVKISQVGLIDALERLRMAGIDTGLALQLFGDRGGPAFDVLVNSIPKIRESEAALNKAEGTAQRIADTMDNNLNGALLAVRSAFEAVTLAIGDFGADNTLTQGARGLASAMRTLAANIDKAVISFSAFAVLVATIRFAPLIQSIATAIGQFITMQRAVAAGNAVILGSAQADKLKAAAALEVAEAEAAKTAAIVASTRAQLAANPFAQTALLGQLTKAEAAHKVQVDALTAAQLRSNTANKAAVPILGSLRTGIQRLFGLIKANPYAALAIAVAAVVAAFVTFKDQIKFSSQGMATLGDVSDEVFERIKLGWDALIEGFRVGIEFYAEKFIGVNEDIEVSFFTVLGAITLTVDQILGVLIGAVEAIIYNWNRIPDAIGLALARAVNFYTEQVNSFLNFLVSGFNKVQEFLGQDALELDFTGAGIKIDESQFEQGAQELADTFLRALQDTPVTDALEQLLADAEKAARARNKGRAPKGDDFQLLPLALPSLSQLERVAQPAKGGPGSPEFQKVLDDLKKEAEFLQLSSREHQFRQELLDLEQSIEGELSEKQRKALEFQLRVNTALRDQASVLDEIRGPQEDLLARQTTLEQLYRGGTITLEQFNEQMKIAKERYEQLAGIEPSGFDQFVNHLKDVPTNTEVMISGFDQASSAIADFVTTGEADFQRFVQSILRQVTQLLINRAILALLGAFTGGAGTAAAQLAPIGPVQANGQFQTGGSFTVGGSGGPDSQAVLFNATPGERVTVQTPGQVQSEQKAPEVYLKSIAVFDPAAAIDAMGSRQGERTIMATVERNAGTIKKILGG